MKQLIPVNICVDLFIDYFLKNLAQWRKHCNWPVDTASSHIYKSGKDLCAGGTSNNNQTNYNNSGKLFYTILSDINTIFRNSAIA